DADGGSLFNRRAVAVGSCFTKADVLHGVHVFAGLLAQLEIGTGAELAFFRDCHGIPAIFRLGRNDPRTAIPLRDFGRRCDLLSSFLPCVHVRVPALRYILIVYLNRGTCQYLLYRVLVNTRGIGGWSKTRKKSGWLSLTDAAAVAGMSGYRAVMSALRSVRSANRLDGTSLSKFVEI